jgi:hypothetical protein
LRHYIYNSALRRAAVARLAELGAGFAALSIGGDGRQDALLASAGALATAARAPATIRADAVLARLEDASALSDLTPAGPAPLLLAFAGLDQTLTAEALAAIAALTSRGWELAAHTIAPAAFGAAQEHGFVLIRAAQTPVERLKLALALDAHALQARALVELELYNRWQPRRLGLDLASVDRVHEVAPFAAEGLTEQIGADSLEEDEGYHAAPPAKAFDAASLSGRALSIHFDARRLPGWRERLAALTAQIAMPTHAEILLAPPEGMARPAAEPLLAPLNAAGLSAKLAQAAAGRAEWTDAFLAATAREARVVALLGDARAPATPGWDWDVLRAAMTAEGDIFAIKTSPEKTRYVSTPAEALRLAEGFPIVSRAWLGVCRSWGCGPLPPAAYQALVAYHFDAIDWANKHRKLRWLSVTTVRTEAVEGAAPPDWRAAPGYAEAEAEAIRAALTLHAADWAAERGAGAPNLVFRHMPGQVILVASTTDGARARWAYSRGAFRPPL